MGDSRPLSDLGLAMVAQLPPALRGSHDYLAVIHACAREVALLEAAIETVRAQFDPATADVLLGAWETQARLPVGGAGADIPTRRARVITRLRKVLGTGEGRQWEAQVTEIVGNGWSYREHDPADGSSPPDGTLLVTLPYDIGSSDYVDAVAQITEITAAHLVLEFASSSVFHWDVSELDVQDFGT